MKLTELSLYWSIYGTRSPGLACACVGGVSSQTRFGARGVGRASGWPGTKRAWERLCAWRCGCCSLSSSDDMSLPTRSRPGPGRCKWPKVSECARRGPPVPGMSSKPRPPGPTAPRYWLSRLSVTHTPPCTWLGAPRRAECGAPATRCPLGSRFFGGAGPG